MSRPEQGRRRLELASSSSGRSSHGADAIDELAGLTSSQPVAAAISRRTTTRESGARVGLHHAADRSRHPERAERSST